MTVNGEGLRRDAPKARISLKVMFTAPFKWQLPIQQKRWTVWLIIFLIVCTKPLICCVNHALSIRSYPRFGPFSCKSQAPRVSQGSLQEFILLIPSIPWWNPEMCQQKHRGRSSTRAQDFNSSCKWHLAQYPRLSYWSSFSTSPQNQRYHHWYPQLISSKLAESQKRKRNFEFWEYFVISLLSCAGK